MDKADILELWSAVGFDTPDADGNKGASEVQLELAMDAFDVSGSIQQAVNEGHLTEVNTKDDHGNETVRAYRLSLGGGS